MPDQMRWTVKKKPDTDRVKEAHRCRRQLSWHDWAPQRFIWDGPHLGCILSLLAARHLYELALCISKLLLCAVACRQSLRESPSL